MDAPSISNPFATWATLTGGLRDRFVAELGAGPRSDYANEMLGALAELERRCEFMGKRLEALERHDPEAFDAFVRALEKS